MPSNVAGYLVPNVSPAPLEDDALDTFFHDVVASVTGIAGDKIIPRWQQEPPTQFARDINWMAVGVIDQDPDTYAAVVHKLDVDDNPVDQSQRHENIDVLVSSYGPNARANLKLLADGLQIDQNRDALVAAGMNLVNTTRIVSAPEVVKDQWLRRFDMHMIVRRVVVREYEVDDIASAEVTIKDGTNTTTVIVVP